LVNVWLKLLKLLFVDYHYADNQYFTTMNILNQSYILIAISCSSFKLAIIIVVRIVINYYK